MKLEVLVVNVALQQLHRETVPLRDGAKVAVAHARIIARMQKRYPEWFRIHVKECNPK